MFTFVLIVHVLMSLLLIMLVLMQSGRGGGLTESFSGAESMFGAKTDAVMVKATTVFAFVFLITSLSLAFLSAQRDKSLLTQASPITAQQEAFDPDALFDSAEENMERIEIDISQPEDAGVEATEPVDTSAPEAMNASEPISENQ
jgi:preprotein translocase subunit SecG